MKEMKNVFLSLGMSGRKGEEIEQDIEDMISIFQDKYDDDVKFIDNFSCERPDDNDQKAYWLGEAIKKLGDCDTILMMYGWQYYKGCHVELAFAKQYGLNILEVSIDLNKGEYDILEIK